MGSETSVSTEKSTSSQTFGTTNPRKKFLIDIKTECQKSTFPAWDRLYDFNVHQTSKSLASHSYVSICCVDEALQHSYLNIHLFLDQQARIHPVAKFMSKDKAQKYFENICSQKITVKQVSMRQFTKLALDLIENHGQYSKFGNSCQTFTATFLSKLQSYSDAVANILMYGTTSPEINQKITNGASTIGGAEMGALGGMAAGGSVAFCYSIGSMLIAMFQSVAATAAAGTVITVPAAAPVIMPYLVGGTIGGSIIGTVAGHGVNAVNNGSKLISAKSCDNEYSKVTNPKQSKSEQEWLEWELKIYQLPDITD